MVAENPAADRSVSDADDRSVSRFGFGDQLIWLCNAESLGDTGEVFEMSRIDRTRISRDAYRGPALTGQDSARETEFFDDINHSIFMFDAVAF